MERKLHLKVSLRAQERYVTQLIHAWHNATICVTWPIHVCGMTHDSHTCVVRVIYAWYAAFTCVTWDLHMCVMICTRATHSNEHVTLTHVWHDAFTRVTRLVPAHTSTYHPMRETCRLRSTTKMKSLLLLKKKLARNITRSTPWAGPRCSWVYYYISVDTYIHRYI